MTTLERSQIQIDSKKYWDEIYQHHDEKELGWYQEVSTPSLELVKKLKIKKDKPILIVGSGTTKFVDNLLEKGFKNIIATDISKVALMNLENRIKSFKHKDLDKKIRFIEDDLRDPEHLITLEPIHLWHDRAVFHYFDEDERKLYLKLLRKLVMKDGYVIFAVYNKQAPKTSTGLKIMNYNSTELELLLGPDFKKIRYFDYDFRQPNGSIRKYVYVAFKRLAKADEN